MSLTWADIVRETTSNPVSSWADRLDDEDERLLEGPPETELELPRNANEQTEGQDPFILPNYSGIGIISEPTRDAGSYADVVRGRVAEPTHPSPKSPFYEDLAFAVRIGDDDVGAPIGIRAIQSILMTATQTNLSHFHTAGMEDGTAGVLKAPSIADTLNCIFKSHNTSMTFTTDIDISDIRKSIVYSDFDSFVSMVRANFIGLPERENVWYETSDASMYDGTIIRFYVDYKKLMKFGLTLSDIGERCFDDDVDCQWAVSPDFMGMIDVGFSSNYIAPVLSRLKCQVCGTHDIIACEYLDPSTVSNEREIVTTGSNVIAVSKVLKGSYKRTLSSNNVADVQRRFGIEAAAHVLTKLIRSVIVSDFMTRTGEVVSFSKHSVEVTRKGLLTSMGFERPKEDIKRGLTAPARSSARVCVYDSLIVGADPNKGFDMLY